MQTQFNLYFIAVRNKFEKHLKINIMNMLKEYLMEMCITKMKVASRQLIKKQRHHCANKVSYSQSYGFSSSHVWIWELDNKKDCQRNDAFELWCWRRLLRVPWGSKEIKSILKEINPGYLLEGLMLKLKLQYFGHLMWRAVSLEKPWCWGRLKAGGEVGVTEDEMVGWHHRLNGCELQQTPRDGEGQGSLVYCSSRGHRVKHNWVTEQHVHSERN